MLFQDQNVAAVFADYKRREADDHVRMRTLGPAAMGIRDEFLLPIGEEAGALLHALILARRPTRILELGTSYGYSTLILADAARSVGARLVTMELAQHKQDYAREMLAKAGLDIVVEFRQGDAVAMIAEDIEAYDFVLLDIWKDLYLPCFEAFYPKLSEEAIIAADNMVEPAFEREAVRLYRSALRAKSDLQTVLLPVGQGIELSVKWTGGNIKL